MPEAIQHIKSTGLPLGLDNVDTDQIIPARFLKATGKSGFGSSLFYDWRYLKDGSPNLSFSLNQPAYQGSQILIAGHNFGCGSSREHAPWALSQYGFKAILAVSFADIFRNNALKNGLVPVMLPESLIVSLLALVEKDPLLPIHIDVEGQQVDLGPLNRHSFELNAFWKTCLLKGIDQVGYTLSSLSEIEAYESRRPAFFR